VEVTGKEKHTRLLRYSCRKFYDTGSWIILELTF
jgi:hypothetical protein